jgi:hypothetical protein
MSRGNLSSAAFARVRLSAMCMVAGAAMTIALSWLCALAGPRLFDRSEATTVWSMTAGPAGRGSHVWSFWVEQRPGAVQVQRLLMPDNPAMVRHAPPAWSAASDPPSDEPGSGLFIALEDARGWPAPAMWRETVLETVEQGEYKWTTRWALVVNPDAGARDQLAIPFQPLWRGFAINTMFYGALALLLVVVPRSLGRARRRRRGGCEFCGYDLRHGAHARCPECGATAGAPAR